LWNSAWRSKKNARKQARKSGCKKIAIQVLLDRIGVIASYRPAPNQNFVQGLLHLSIVLRAHKSRPRSFGDLTQGLGLRAADKPRAPLVGVVLIHVASQAPSHHQRHKGAVGSSKPEGVDLCTSR